MVENMKFTVQHSLGKEGLWKLFTSNEFICKWLATESDINWKKNGKVRFTITPGKHEVKKCKLIEFNPFDSLSFTWMGPEEFDITMNFKEYLTHVRVIFQDTTLSFEHEGWRSSEDWQEAKKWHENVFWPEKITTLTKILQNM